MAAARLSVLTLNLRNLADRWDERLPLLLAEFAVLQPDVAGLQEVVYVMQQDRLLGASGAGQYEARRGWAGRPEYGNALLLRAGRSWRAGSSGEGDRLDLGLARSAHQAVLRHSAGPISMRVVNTHLHHEIDGAAQRDAQVESLLGWLDGLPPAQASIVTGDFNAAPTEPACARMIAAGFRSAFREANGAEPDVTWPSGLIAPAMDTDGDPACLDYVWVRGAVRTVGARLCFDRPAVDDPTLFPSDHRGVLVELEVG